MKRKCRWLLLLRRRRRRRRRRRPVAALIAAVDSENELLCGTTAEPVVEELGEEH